MKATLTKRILPVIVAVFLVITWHAVPVTAQQTVDDPHAATGGAQTLEDILARQAKKKVDDSFRRKQLGDPANATGLTNPLGTLGGVSDADIYRAYRYGEADITVSTRNPESAVVIQDSGMYWLDFRAGPLRTYGLYLLGGMIVLLAVFYLIRGRIRIEGGRTGVTIERFSAAERFGHWLLAGSFILLALTGLTSLFGRVALIPLIGKEAYAAYAIVGKWIHNNVAWAFIAGLIWVFVFWVAQNIPGRTDLVWLAKGGGLFSKGLHPPAPRFNAGQKLFFWLVLLLGGSIALSGLSLLFPMQLPLFAKTFAIIDIFGFDLPTTLRPLEEMQLAQAWHSGVSFILIAIVFAHIYIGSLGMEGAFDAVGSGHVEKEWAREHHSLWVEEQELKSGSDDSGKQVPAE
ncbi:MAG: formate dehydrogenase subunit gamma [Paracoccaceae bacterium]